jgi:tetratricopeptide (TPR) repeat protein
VRSLLLIFVAGCALTTLLAGCAANGPNEKQASPLEKKLSDNPNDRAVNLRLGEEAEATGDTLRAEQYYLRAEALGVPEDEMIPRLLRVLVKAQRYDEALEKCKKRLDVKPEDRATRYVEAALYMAVDRPKEAEKELDSLVRTKPDDADAYLALGRLYKDIGDQRARPMFEKYLALAPNGEAAAQVRYELAEPAPAEQPHDP